MKITNISDGPRGAYLDGSLIMANPGETIEADDYSEEWFEVADEVANADKPRRGRPPKVEPASTEDEEAE